MKKSQSEASLMLEEAVDALDALEEVTAPKVSHRSILAPFGSPSLHSLHTFSTGRAAK